jgi:hypothetical protein
MSRPDDDSFEQKVRAIANELSQSAERVLKNVDLDEIAQQIELGGERVRDLADATARWLGDRLSDPGAHDAPGAEDFAPESDRTANESPRVGPHPLDVPSDEQGRALSALDSGRWKVRPGTDELVDAGGGTTPAATAGLVGELRARDWIAATGEVTLVGREALKRWSEGSTASDNAPR